MTPTEAAALLTVAAAFDNRKPDADAAKAWALALAGLAFADARDAIVEHYTRTKDWIMPADVRTIVRRIRAKRIAEDAELSPPPGLDPDRTGDYAKWLVRAREDAAAGIAPEPQPLGRRNIAELGNVGATVPSEAREAVARAKSEVARSEGAKRALREAKVARLAAAREADRKARAGESEEVAS